MNHQPIVDRTIRGHDRGPRRARLPARSLDGHRITILNPQRARPGKNASAKIDNRAGETVEIMKRMELRLPREPQHAIGVELSDRHAVDALDPDQTGAMR